MHWNRLPTGDRIRVAGYVCYEPRSHASEEQLKRKAEIFHNRQVATHVSVRTGNADAQWPLANDVRELYQGGPKRDGKPDPYSKFDAYQS